MASGGENTRYFITKSVNFEGLKTCTKTGIWACSDRTQPPQPKDVLTSAYHQGNIILIFSVNNQHGWHGYAKMTSPPGSVDNQENIAENLTRECDLTVPETSNTKCSSNVHVQLTKWHRFTVKWITVFFPTFGEQCLPFSKTAHLQTDPGVDSPVNKARNIQEISQNTGVELCTLIDNHMKTLTEKQAKKAELVLAKAPPAFYDVDKPENIEAVWEGLVKKVSHMGEVLLACAFGSQRYNLHTEDSDMDMFVVYAAPAVTVLGFNPPQQTIKNKETENSDYTIHEVHHYLELILNGDPRCIETLFLHPSAIYYCSDRWRDFCKLKNNFLKKNCMEKYLRDACGAKGTRYIEKVKSQNVDPSSDIATPKLCKMFYIVTRLLQNAREVAFGEELQVYRHDNSPNHKLLMATRRGEKTYSEMQAEVDRLLGEIEEKRPFVEERDSNTQELVEKWLLNLRYESLKQDLDK
ncbi:unnamed protein product [Owenia fusiformis]|uniref:Uncharacterized protein n=1 Tax=Owenia fusiformis TaxID=6347 RepID=A0A8J1TZR3_OWEFU|nr:unnamed protein product [Owenia fusiformis]